MMKDLSPLVVGLDCSTTACKAIVWDCRGRSIAKGYSSLALLAPQPAWHEQPAIVAYIDDSRYQTSCESGSW
jgi:sugar (pentulose or hexulose) kinase